jgi:hypothetical protein
MSDRPIAFDSREAAHGFAWLSRAAKMFRAAPLPWLLLLFVYYLLVGLAEFGPWGAIGEFVAPLLRPVFAVGFLAAAWAQERGGTPKFGHLFRGFRSDLKALLPLGVVFLGGMLLAVRATALVDGGELIALLSGTERPSEAILSSGRVQVAMLFGAACALPTLLATWFAPALVVFHDAGARTALVTSLRASLANWRPIAVYGLSVFALGGIVPVFALGVAQLLAEGAAGPVLLFVVMPYMFVFIATLHISDYVSYRDIFPADAMPQAPAAAV